MMLPEIKVDGAPVSVSQVMTHHQERPYPGGHEYEWLIPVEFISKKIGEAAGFKSCEQPTTKESSDWFYWLGSIKGKWIRDDASSQPAKTGLRFVLNNIHSIRFSEGMMIVTGEASPYVAKVAP